MYVSKRQNMATVCAEIRSWNPQPARDKNVFFCSCSTSDKHIQLQSWLTWDESSLTWDTACVCMWDECTYTSVIGFMWWSNLASSWKSTNVVCVFDYLHDEKETVCVCPQSMLTYICIMRSWQIFPFEYMYNRVVSIHRAMPCLNYRYKTSIVPQVYAWLHKPGLYNYSLIEVINKLLMYKFPNKIYFL